MFIETVFIDNHETLLSLARWLRQRGRERRQAIWLRDAALAERLDSVLLIGLKDWYPPIYDCGACGFATCAESIIDTYLPRRTEVALGGIETWEAGRVAAVAYLPATRQRNGKQSENEKMKAVEKAAK